MAHDLDSLTDAVLAFRDKRDWKQFHRPKDLALALNIEASELAELFLWKSDEEIAKEFPKGDKDTAVSEEIADILIYSLLLAEHFGIDPGEAIMDKLAKNEAKYPVAKSKGNARKYTEFEG